MDLSEILTDTCARSKATIEQAKDRKHKHAPIRFMFCRRAIDVFGNNVTLEKIGREVGYTHSSVIRAWRATYEIKEMREKYNQLWPSNK